MPDIRGRGIVLRQRKNSILTAPIKEYSDCKQLSVPISYGAKVLFAIGSAVARNDLIAVDSAAGINIYSPCAGVLESITACDHPLLGKCDLLNLTVSESAEIEKNIQLKLGEGKLSYQEITGIVDTLDGKSLAHKLKEFSADGITTLAADAIQDQPFVCSESGVLYNHYTLVEEGLKIAAELAGIQRTEVFVYYRRDRGEPELKFDSRITVVCGKYPARYPYIAKNKKKIGFISAQACFDLIKLVRTGEQQLTTVVTVAGHHITKPSNVRVPIGTPIGELIDFCEPDNSPAAVIVGGPLTGKYTEDLTTPVYPGMGAVLLLEPISIREMANCWGCGECVRCCPEGLMPLYIARFSRHGKLSDCRDFGVLRCIECGCCSYVCTGGLDPMSFILSAKNQLKSYRTTQQKQELPQRRHPLSSNPSATPELKKGGDRK
ncbi:MAG TPA: SLBB domain-containing protein [Oscillospiraceae bacterium]|nr:SLBB domain-containing protein [Oscillospiraceae bacterium]HPF55997.1 SLBB domain-containing protein [Clostridiales bacterium]HPK36209.1 SLBB domain-containing protein [Oscillospiraceae bacterium]HPR75700.1 SLBB domain-containing protein [Oscillospiraceae bacterium]